MLAKPDMTSSQDACWVWYDRRVHPVSFYVVFMFVCLWLGLVWCMCAAFLAIPAFVVVVYGGSLRSSRANSNITDFLARFSSAILAALQLRQGRYRWRKRTNGRILLYLHQNPVVAVHLRPFLGPSLLISLC